MNELQVAWSAGLFEGEGCIHLRATSSGRLRTVLILRMADEDVVRRFAATVGSGRVRGPLAVAKPHHRPNYEWRLYRWAEVEELLRAMLPHFGERRSAKAAEALRNPVGLFERKRQTHCKRGHPLAGPEADVYERPGVQRRQCKVCVRLRDF